MTVSTPTMGFFVREPMPRPALKGGHAPAADAEARRLASAVGRGDEAAFGERYDRYQNRLFSFALAVSRGDEALARETVQSVFVTAAGSLRSVESEEHLWNWLARIARQQIVKAWRQRQRDLAVIGVEELPDCAQVGPTDSELEENLDAALFALSEEDRQVLEWFYFDELSQKQVAERLNATPKAVSSRLERARAKLRSLLKRRSSQ